MLTVTTRSSTIWIVALLVFLFSGCTALLYAYRSQTPSIPTVPITQAVQDIQAGKVKTVTESANKATLELNDGAKESTNLPDNSRTDPLQDAVAAYDSANPTRPVLLRWESGPPAVIQVFGSILLSLLPLVLFVALVLLAVAAFARARTADPYERLARLADLRDRAVLTEEEFQREKRKILG
jgi:ATP-dependent Zn protease